MYKKYQGGDKAGQGSIQIWECGRKSSKCPGKALGGGWRKWA